jgi:hypothetical protein
VERQREGFFVVCNSFGDISIKFFPRLFPPNVKNVSYPLTLVHFDKFFASYKTPSTVLPLIWGEAKKKTVKILSQDMANYKTPNLFILIGA